MQRLGPRAYLALERFLKVFTICGHGSHFEKWTAPILAIFRSPAQFLLHEIWATLAQRLQRRSHLKLSKNVWGPYKCIQKQTWPRCKKGQMSKNDHYFSNFGRPPIPDDLCKDSAIRHPRFWKRRFLKVFTIYGHGGHLGQWTKHILAIFHFPAPGRLQMKFEQHWSRGSKGKVIWNSQHFFPMQIQRKANLTSP